MSCAMVSAPKTVRLVCGEPTKEAGFQNLNAAVSDKSPDEVIINLSVFGDVPWPATSVEVDSQTYGAADANKYVVYDKAGKQLESRIKEFSVNQRMIRVTLKCSGEPASVDTTVFTHLNLDKKVQIPVPQDGPVLP